MFFWHGWKLGFTNCVFEKLCSENTILIALSAKNSSCNKKAVCWEKQKTYEKLWVVFQHGKMVFFGLFFWGFDGFVVCLCVWYSCKSVKMLVFSWFGGLLCGGLFLLFGFGRFVFCGSWFAFLLFSFCFCLFWHWFCFVVGLLLVLLLFCFCFLLFFWRV